MPGDGVLDLVVNDSPKWLDEHMLLRGVKAATYPFRSAGDYQGYDFTNLDGPGFNGDGFRSRAFVPAQFTKQPELFWGPFLQLGTYLKGQGMIESDGAALALDIALDPTNLIGTGAFGLLGKATKGALGLTEAAKAARLFTALSKAGEIKDAGKAVEAGLDALEQGWKLSGFRPELLEAAKAGDKGAVKKIVDTARATGRLTDEQSQLLSAMRKDRGLLKGVVEHINELHGKMLQPEDLRQGTILESWRAGHVEPFLKVAKPWQQLAKGNPLKFAGEMVGLHFADTDFWFPAADITATALDKLGAGGLHLGAGEQVAKEGMRVGEKIAAEKSAYEAMGLAARKTGIPAWQSVMGIEGMKVLIGAQDEHLARTLGLDIFTPGSLEREFRQINYLTDKQSLSVPEYKDAFERFKEDRITRVGNVFRRMDNESMRRRQLSMNIAAGAMQDMVGPVDEAQAIGMLDQTTADAAKAQLRKIQDVFRIRSLQMDMHSPGNGMAARATLTNLLARTMNHNIKATLKKGYPNRAGREMIDETLKTIIDHPDLWEFRDGRYFLTGTKEDMDAAGADFLKATLQSAAGGKSTAGLEAHLRNEGLDPEVSFVVTHMKDAYEQVGKNLLDQRIIGGLNADYSARVFTPNAKYKQLRNSGQSLPDIYAKVFSQDAEGQTFERLAGMTYGQYLEEAKQGKLTFAEQRRFSEAELVALEQNGYGKLEKSSSLLFSGYMASAGQAVLFSRLFRDLPEMAGDVTRSAVAGRWGEEIAARLGYKGITRVMRQAPPEEWKPFFREITSTPLGTLDRDNTELALARARLSQLSTMHRSADWQAGVVREGERIRGAAEKLSLDALKGGIGVLDEAHKKLDALEAVAARVRALGQEEVRGGVGTISAAEGKVNAAYNAAQGAWNNAQQRILGLQDKALQMELDMEELARQRVAKRLSGRTSVGGFKIRLNGQEAGFDPEWLISGKYPEGLVAARQLKKAADGELQRELATVIKETQGDKYVAARQKVLEGIEKLKARSDEVVKGANDALDKHLERIGAKEKQAGQVAAGAERKLQASEKRLQRLVPDADMARIKKRMERKLADFTEQYEKNRAIELQSQRLGKWNMRARLAKLRGEAAEGVAEASKVEREANKVWVFEPDYGHLQEAFGLYDQGKHSAFWDTYDRWNYRLKGLVLLGDVFHFNTLAISQFLTAPERALKMLVDDAGHFKPGVEAGMHFWRPSQNVAAGTIAGAGIGAAVGEMRGGDASETTGFSLAGALYGMTISAALKNSREALAYAMNPENIDTLMMMGLGGWSGRPNDRAIGVLNAGMKTLRDKLARDPVAMAHALVDPIDKVRHVLDWWDDTLWETLHNGSKHYHFSVVYPKRLAELQASKQWGEEALRAEFKSMRGLPEKATAEALPSLESRQSTARQEAAERRVVLEHGELPTADKRAISYWNAVPASGEHKAEALEGWERGHDVASAMAKDLGLRLRVAAHTSGWEGVFHPSTPDTIWIAPPDYTRLVRGAGQENISRSPGNARALASTSVLFTAGHEIVHAVAQQHPEMQARIAQWALKSADTETLSKVAEKIAEKWGLAGYTGSLVTQARNATARDLVKGVSNEGVLSLGHDTFLQLRKELSQLQAGEKLSADSPLHAMVRDSVSALQNKPAGADVLTKTGGLLKYITDVPGGTDLPSIVSTMVNRALEEATADSGGSYLLNENFWKTVAKEGTPQEKGVLMRVVDAILDAIKKMIGTGFGGASMSVPGAHPGQATRKAFDDIAEELIKYRRQYLAMDLEAGSEAAKTLEKGEPLLRPSSFNPVRGVTPSERGQPVGIELTKSDNMRHALSRAFRELGWLEPGTSQVVFGGKFFSPTKAVRLEGTTLIVDAHPDKLGDVLDLLSHLEDKGGKQSQRLADVINYVVTRQSLIDSVDKPEWVATKMVDGKPVAVVHVGNKEYPKVFKQTPPETKKALPRANEFEIAKGTTGEKAVGSRQIEQGGARVATKGRGGDLAHNEEAINAALEFLQERQRAIVAGEPGARRGLFKTPKRPPEVASEAKTEAEKVLEKKTREFLKAHEKPVEEAAAPKEPVVSAGRKALMGLQQNDTSGQIRSVIDRAVGQLNPQLQDAWLHMGPKELGGRDLAPIAYGTLRQLSGGEREAGRLEANRRLYTTYVALQGNIAKEVGGGGIPLRPPSFNPGMVRPAVEQIASKGVNPAEFEDFVRTRRWQMKTALAREVVQAGNVVFGGQTWRYLLDNPQFQTIARRVLLSPDWTGSRLAMSANMLMNMDPMKRAIMGAGVGQAVEYVDAGGDPDKAFSGRGPVFGAALGLALGKWADGIQRRMMVPGDVMAKEARRMAGAALVGGYVMANALNMAFTGRWLFENPEGKRTSIDIGNGDYVSLGKPWTETFEYGGFYEKEHYPIPVVSRLASKQAVLPLHYVQLFANSNAWGGPIITAQDGAYDVSRKAFAFTLEAAAPIIAQGPVRFGIEKFGGTPSGGDISTALLRSAGFRVSTPIQSGNMANLQAFMNSRGSALRDLPVNLGKN